MAITIKNILPLLAPLETKGNTNVSCSQVVFDSRQVNAQSLFVALKGTATDGHKFIQQAIKQGALAIICETIPENADNNVTYIKVKDSHEALGTTASAFYNNPSHQLKVVGITGTNGKTTVATLLHNLFMQMGYKSGLLSTVEVNINGKILPATHTTPDAVQINQNLSEMASTGCEVCFMEVSSHAIHQKRIAGIKFAGAVFTNITHDHLDYHSTFQEYLNVKKQLFDNLSDGAFALSNIDDKNGRVMLQNTKAKKKTYSVKSISDYKLKLVEQHFDGMLLNINGQELWTRFIGDYNASNLLAVYATGSELGQPHQELLTQLSNLTPVRGRLEYFKNHQNIIGIIDYAHTPDALKNVLNTLNQLKGGNSQIITVFGAGGNRDKSKRPAMGEIAAKNSSKVIVTSDNPRNEEPQDIINDILAGITPDLTKKVLTITQRDEAIKTACMLAQPGDIILVAGKGHENYQEIKGIKHPFDDKEIITNYLQNA